MSAPKRKSNVSCRITAFGIRWGRLGIQNSVLHREQWAQMVMIGKESMTMLVMSFLDDVKSRTCKH